MAIVDDRTAEQRATHTSLVKGACPSMSGWGNAPGTSYAAWACEPDDSAAVLQWVENRGDMRRVSVLDADTYRPRLRAGDHFHIYVVGPNHPALS